MTTPSTFSVIIATRNRPRELRSCIEALGRLDYPAEAFEVIVVDDGGDETPRGEVTSAGPRVAIYRQAQGGPASARNTGVSHARNEFLAFTDDDCLPAPDWLGALAARLSRNPGQLIGGKVVNGLTANVYSAASQHIADMVYAYYNADPGAARMLTTNNMAIRASTFRDLGGFDRSFPLASEDREFCDRARSRGCSLVYAPEALVEHRHNLSLTSFLRQHFGYGRGAALFHRARARRSSGSYGDHLKFHANLPRLFRETGGSIRLVPLLALWQGANLAGYLYERTR